MRLSLFWSKAFLMDKRMLWLLFIVNFLGTVYGYIWYNNQLIWTYENFPTWLLVFVPDSPTASLFFTVSLLYMLFPTTRLSRIGQVARIIIEALAVVTSIKYGIWAVAMIVWGYWQGDVLVWQDYMLIVSHLGMALEVMLYLRFMKAGAAALTAALAWVLLNDTLDYTYGIYPWLPEQLKDDVPAVKTFTFCLSIASYISSLLLLKWRRQS